MTEQRPGPELAVGPVDTFALAQLPDFSEEQVHGFYTLLAGLDDAYADLTILRAERDALADAAREIRDFQQAGGSDWWDAHDRLYAVLDARHPPTEESRDE